MSTITGSMFVLAVNDLAASAAYYRDVLGFTVQEIGDDGWRIFRRDTCRIMVGHCPDAIPPRQLGDHNYFAYINVDGIDDYYATVQARGANILKTLRNEPWGMREFAIRTADGHRIMFGIPITQEA